MLHSYSKFLTFAKPLSILNMHHILIFMSVLILGSIGHLATDIYLPSMPSMAEYFDTSNTLVQFTLSAYMLSFCFTPLIIGPLSDKIGRKRPILLGILIGLVATFLCIFSTNIYFLVFGRFLQGIGLGIVVCVSRAILPDRFQGKDLAKYYSILTMFMPVVLAIGPSLGAFIHEYSSWHGVFIFLASYLVVIVFLTYYLFQDKEKSEKINSAELKTVFHVYKDLLSNKKFLLFTLCSVFIFIGISAYLTVWSFLFQERLGLTPRQSAATSLITFTAIFAMGYLNIRLMSFFKPKKLLYLVNPFILASGILLIFCDMTNNINIYTLIFSVTLYFCALPVTFANANSLAFASIQGNFGAAVALLSCIQFLSGGVASAIISFTDSKSVIPLGMTFMLVGIGTFILLLLEGQVKKPHSESTAVVGSV